MNSKWVFMVLKVLISLVVVVSAIGKLTKQEALTQSFDALGYPQYMLNILGVAFLLGVVAIWQKRSMIGKEWGYAGFFITLIGAIASHIFSGHAFVEAVPATILLTVLTLTYWLEKRATHLKN